MTLSRFLPKLKKHDIHPQTLSVIAYASVPVMVALVTYALHAIMHAMRASGASDPRPFGVVYLVAVVIATIVGGRGPGYVALVLSELAMAIFLLPRDAAMTTRSYGDAMEAAFLGLTGVLMVIGIDSLRALRPLLYESEQATARLRAVMENAPIGVLISTIEGAIRYANPEAERILGRKVVGLRLDIWDDGASITATRERGKPVESILTPCLNGKDVELREWSIVQGETTLTTEARATLVRDQRGKPINGLVTLTDITDRNRKELLARSRANREALVNRIGEAIRGSLDPNYIQNAAVTALGEALKLDRCYFMTYDLPADYAWVGEDYHRSDLPAMSGHYRTSDLRLRPDTLYQPGRTLVIDDVRSTLLPPILATDFERQAVSAIIGVPLFNGDQLVATLVVAMADTARTWSAEEILLVEAVAAQTRSAVEMARMLIQEQNRRRTEEVTSRIAQTLRYATEPDIILSRTLSIVGDALETDRCCYLSIDSVEGKLWCADDYYGVGLKSISESHSPIDLGKDFLSHFAGGATLVVDDVSSGSWSKETASLLLQRGLSAIVGVPILEDDRLLGVLIVAMADRPRTWKAEEIRLVEIATAQCRLTLDAARVRQREHTVAETLQRALQPPPDNSPCFELDFYYQPALDEASVGGDFYDVFEIRPQVFAIVIGDVSGKGIAAAAQIASVRNMLRYVFDHEPDLAVGLGRLNNTLARTGQLIGFATLFAGVYDHSNGTLTYGSCGHEPAIIRRSDGSVEQLMATGPPVGAIDDAEYDEETVRIGSGDLLLLYTDGISEAGPSRQALLGTEGIINFLTQAPPGEPPPVLISRLMADVKQYANGILRDDVCIVAALIDPVESSPSLELVDGSRAPIPSA
ncbi:MAG TPA: SpoIIE family protein phosphatase [Capsulimonadaceae bacterium]|jgi:sigma-B regulation protein RsbU (phosphoserine phosphatase)